ncbi:MAG: hypothetical protein HKN20_01955 [Gemmatimonadetes bacterium]|nr:hypothetical protein [Gemmatimonadota bacterium]
MGWIRNVRSDWERFGAAKACARVTYKLANRVGRVDLLRLMELREEDIRIPDQTGPPLTERFVLPEEMPALCDQFGPRLPRRFVDLAIAKGDDCFALFDGATCASFGWYSRQPTIIRGNLLFRFDPAFLYMYHGYTSPPYRGRRLHAIGIGRRARLAFENRDARSILSIVEKMNYSTHRSAQRLGFRFTGSMWRVGAGPFSTCGTSAACRQYGISIEEVRDPFAMPEERS